MDADGNLFGTTPSGGAYGAGTVFEIAKGTSTIQTIASFNGSDGSYPRGGITVDATDDLYGTTASGGANNDGTVFEIAKGSASIRTLSSFNGANGASPYAAVTLDAAGDIFGTTFSGGSSGNGTVFEIANGGAGLQTIASFNGNNGAYPFGGITLDASGNLYGTTEAGGSSNQGTVFVIPKGTNTISTVASFNGANGTAPFAGITLDSSGNFFGTTLGGGSYQNGTVFEIAQGSSSIRTLASFNGANGDRIYGGVTTDSSGNLYGTANEGGP